MRTRPDKRPERGKHCPVEQVEPRVKATHLAVSALRAEIGYLPLAMFCSWPPTNGREHYGRRIANDSLPSPILEAIYSYLAATTAVKDDACKEEVASAITMTMPGRANNPPSPALKFHSIKTCIKRQE